MTYFMFWCMIHISNWWYDNYEMIVCWKCCADCYHTAHMQKCNYTSIKSYTLLEEKDGNRNLYSSIHPLLFPCIFMSIIQYFLFEYSLPTRFQFQFDTFLSVNLLSSCPYLFLLDSRCHGSYSLSYSFSLSLTLPLPPSLSISLSVSSSLSLTLSLYHSISLSL